MIISCNNCNKKFDIDSKLIPEKGRLLQCSSCNYKWFYEKEIINEPAASVKVNKPIEKIEPIIEGLRYKKIENSENIELLDNETSEIKSSTPIIAKIEGDKPEINLKNETLKDKKSYNILGLIMVFIISFIALIITLDTFQNPISKIVPNIEFILYSLYETINDIKLFLKDLI
ncbi:zinc-ribbon domain-containing protein [Candidatus Pelagibacter sp. Uisw_134_02]|uniref:zinc-ribbon domain-containing protein n=1 Tax=Candidatus Pelagibacter sp. Uisw_134_02 TaxID=3230990 RepID=UPI0039EA8C06